MILELREMGPLAQDWKEKNRTLHWAHPPIPPLELRLVARRVMLVVVAHLQRAGWACSQSFEVLVWADFVTLQKPLA